MLKIKTIRRLLYGLPSAILASAFLITQSLSCDVCNCLEAGQFSFGDKTEGTSLRGQSKDYSKGALQSVSFLSDFVPLVAIIPAATSIVSSEAALASSIVNVCSTLIPLYGGLYASEINMRRIAWKVGISTLMVGATAASFCSWMTYPDAHNSGSGGGGNGTSSTSFQASYTTNVVLTGIVAATNIGGALAMYLCRHSPGENAPIYRDPNSLGYGTSDSPRQVFE